MLDLIEKMIKQEDIDTGIHTGEAYILWTQLVARYDTSELTEIILDYAKDSDFKVLIKRGLDKIIMPQINELEKTMSHYRIPLPPRPPKSQNIPVSLETARDQFLFKLLLDGSQTALTVHTKAVNICINDSLRNLFMNFLVQELTQYDSLVKYGKVKGWVGIAPGYKTA